GQGTHALIANAVEVQQQDPEPAEVGRAGQGDEPAAAGDVAAEVQAGQSCERGRPGQDLDSQGVQAVGPQVEALQARGDCALRPGHRRVVAEPVPGEAQLLEPPDHRPAGQDAD